MKNPLGGIRGAAQLLQLELATEQHEYTEVIVSEVDRLHNLVDRLLGPNKAPSFAQVNIHQILERVIALESAAVGTAGHTNAAIEFVREYDPSVPDLEADAEQLVQANLNIVRNACAALEPIASPVITLTTSVVHRFTIRKRIHPLAIRIAISDNGPGIPRDIMDQIFFPMITSKANGQRYDSVKISTNSLIQRMKHVYLDFLRVVFVYTTKCVTKKGTVCCSDRKPAAFPTASSGALEAMPFASQCRKIPEV